MTRHAVSVMSIILWLASASSGIAASFESNADVPVLDGVELLNRDSDDDSITIVSEEHSIIPAQELLTLRKHSDVLLEIIEGPARFIYKPGAQGDAKILTKVTYQADHVRLPAIVHGDEKHNSYISIVVDGSVICKPLRLAALPRGIFELYGELPSFAPAILRLDLARGYALIDEADLDDAAAIRDLQESQKFQELTKKP